MITWFALLYLLAMLGIGAVSRRQAREPVDFFVAGRRGSATLVTSSLLATILGASATLGVVGRGYRDGWVGAWWLLAGVAGLVLLAFGYAERFRALGVYTAPEALERQYGPLLRRPAAVLIAIAWLGVIAAQIAAAGQLLSHAAPGSAQTWMVVAAVVFLAYTALGGQVSVLKTDAGQVLLLVVGLLVCAGFALTRMGGWSGLATLPEDLRRFPVNAAMGPREVLAWLVTVGLTYTAGPDMISRLCCTRDAATARRAALLTSLALAPLAFVIAGLGLTARALLPDTPSEQALPRLIALCLPAWAAGLAHAALLAAMMSSADTCLLTTATVLARDLGNSGDERALLRRARWLMALVTLAALGIAIRLGGIVDSLMWAYTAYTCGVAVPLLAGFHRDRLGLTAPGALAALLGGGGLGLAGKLLGQDWALPAVALGVILLWAASRLFRNGAEGDRP